MTATYEIYKGTNEWIVIQEAIEQLVNNQDLLLKTTTDLVVGFITKNIIEAKKNNL